MAAAKTQAQNLINEGGVVVFSKSYCPFCHATKSTLDKLKAEYTVLELDREENGSAIQDALEEISEQRTVPNIYIGKKHIGGNSDLQKIKGQLPTLLKEVGAL